MFCRTACKVLVSGFKWELEFFIYVRKDLVTPEYLSFIKNIGFMVAWGCHRGFFGIPLFSFVCVCVCGLADWEMHVLLHHPGRATGFSQVEGIIFYLGSDTQPLYQSHRSALSCHWAWGLELIPLGSRASALLQDWATSWYFQGYCIYEQFCMLWNFFSCRRHKLQPDWRPGSKKAVYFFVFFFSWSRWILKM